MNVLDENIVVSQRELLRSWKIHFRRIGGEVGRLGMGDRDEIIPLLHSLARPTFFTQDHGFYHPGFFILATVSCILMSFLMKWPNTRAVSCAIGSFARIRNGWARSRACAPVASAIGRSIAEASTRSVGKDRR